MRLRNPTQMISMSGAFQFCAQTAKSSEFEQHIRRDDYHKLSANQIVAKGLAVWSQFTIGLFAGREL